MSDCQFCKTTSIVTIVVISDEEVEEDLPVCQEHLNNLVAHGEQCEQILSEIVAAHRAGVDHDDLIDEAEDLIGDEEGDEEEGDEEPEEETEEPS